MDINSLRSFVLFSQYGTLNKVATAQHRTNAAISAQMKKLSNTYKIELFEKQGRNLILTASGKEFLNVASCILNFHDKIIVNIKESEAILTIKIGIPSDYVGEYLLLIINYLSCSLKKIKFELFIKSSNELYQLWKNNEVDITIYSANHNHNEGYVIGEVQGYWFSSKNYSIRDSGRFEIALFDESCLFHQKAIEGLREKNTTFNIHSISSDSRTICSLVENFNIITAMSKISKTNKMVIIEDPRLPKLPKVFLKLLLSKKLESINAKSLVKVLKPITYSLENIKLQKDEQSQVVEAL